MLRLFSVFISFSLIVGCHFNVKVEQQIENSEVDNLAVEFVAAYNAHDSEKMLSFVHDDIKYMYIDGASIYTETKDKTELSYFLKNFFNNKPNAQSEIISSHQNDRFIHQVEKAIWQNKKGEVRAQCSLSVYELKDKLIINVWYYSAYQCM